MRTIALILSFLFQGFVSVPLAIHISNFSISISLDSILWAGIGKILELKVKEELEEKETLEALFNAIINSDNEENKDKKENLNKEKNKNTN